MVVNVFPPKSKEEILEQLKWMSIENFKDASSRFEVLFDEEVPDEYYPLIYMIHKDLEERPITLKRGWGETGFMAKIRGTHTRFQIRNGRILNYPNYVSITMFPYRKRKCIKDITFGNEFRLTSFEDYLRVMRAYEL